MRAIKIFGQRQNCIFRLQQTDYPYIKAQILNLTETRHNCYALRPLIKLNVPIIFRLPVNLYDSPPIATGFTRYESNIAPQNNKYGDS